MIAPINASGPITSGSYVTVAFSIRRFTVAPLTPSCLPSTFCRRDWQDAHVIPLTGSSIVASAVSDAVMPHHAAVTVAL